MAVLYVSAGTMAGSASSASLATSFPATVNNGDIAIIIATAYNNITLPASFTSEAQVSDAGTATNFRMGWKRCDGSEDSTTVNVTQTAGQIWAQIFIFSGAIASGTPYEGYSAVTATDTDGNLTTPAIVSTVDGTLGVLVCSINGAEVTFTPASGFTERVDNSSAAGAFNSHTVDTIIKSGGGSTAAGTITASSSTGGGYVVFGFALKQVVDPTYAYFAGEHPTLPAHLGRHKMIGY